MPNNYITALDNQNAWDMCLQETGTIESVFDFISANNGANLENNLTVNKRYLIPSTGIISTYIKEYIAKTKIKIVTAIRTMNVRITEEGVIRETEEGVTRIIE